MSQNNIAKSSEETSLQWFAKEIRNHIFSRTVNKVNIAFVNSILNKEIPDVDMSRTLSSGLSTVFLHFHCALVILVEDVVL